jgi:hypothetical protein
VQQWPWLGLPQLWLVPTVRLAGPRSMGAAVPMHLMVEWAKTQPDFDWADDGDASSAMHLPGGVVVQPHVAAQVLPDSRHLLYLRSF